MFNSFIKWESNHRREENKGKGKLYFVDTVEGGLQNEEEENTVQTSSVTPRIKNDLTEAIAKLKIGKTAGYYQITAQKTKYLDRTGVEVIKEKGLLKIL